MSTKSILRRNEFIDQTTVDFIKISPISALKHSVKQESSEEVALKEILRKRQEEFEKSLEEKKKDFEVNLDQEKHKILEEAKKEAQDIIKQSKESIEEEKIRSQQEIENLSKELEQEREILLQEAQEKSESLIKEAQEKEEEWKEEAYHKGFEEGYEDSFKKGEEHLKILFKNIQNIADHLLEKRQQILKETQGQLVSILISSVRKVIHKLAEDQEGIIIKTLQEALLRVTSRSDIVLRVNPKDFSIVEEWVPRLKERFENLTSLKVFEDSKIENGGCLIETDFGEIDARIATQISRIEERILEANPLSIF